MTIPVTSSEVQVFTPESLKEKMGDDAPKFRLRAPSEKCLRRFRATCQDEGLSSYNAEDFADEKRIAIKALWSGEDADQLQARYDTVLVMIEQGIELSDSDVVWLRDLENTLFENWQPLRVMQRKTGEMMEYGPRIAISTYVAGWDNFDATFKMEGGYLAMTCVSEVIKQLKALGKQHCDAENTPFLELYVAASARLRLDEDEEKNSPAPSQPISNPDASTDMNPADGKSIAESVVDETTSTSSDQTKTPSDT